MRRYQRHIYREETEINLTPMLDIVFIMLIFFIVTTSFIKESGVDVSRPNAETTERQERGNILVAITPAGEIWIDGRPVDIRNVRASIERLKAESPEGEVVVQGDKHAEIGVLVRVMDQIRLAGVVNVSLAADQP